MNSACTYTHTNAHTHTHAQRTASGKTQIYLHARYFDQEDLLVKSGLLLQQYGGHNGSRNRNVDEEDR
jgi:hypothetical protein